MNTLDNWFDANKNVKESQLVVEVQFIFFIVNSLANHFTLTCIYYASICTFE